VDAPQGLGSLQRFGASAFQRLPFRHNHSVYPPYSTPATMYAATM
jgi:hypothetical protein